MTEVIPDVKKATLKDVVNRNVAIGSTVSTDELFSYGLLDGDGYKHGTVKHGAKEWAVYDYRENVTHHVNHVASFWKLFKASVRSTHIHMWPSTWTAISVSSRSGRTIVRLRTRCSIF